MPRILVTGSKGFIGRHVMESIEAEGFDIGDPMPSGEFDGIVHLAAVSRVSAGNKDPVGCMQTNVILTAQMLELAPKWFIFISSMEKARNFYGLSKKCAEDYVRLKTSRHVILRLSNVYGAGDNTRKLLSRIRAGETLTLNPSIFPFEYVPVSEVVAQIKRTIRSFDQPHFRPYTMKLASGIARNAQELLDVAASY